MSSSVRRLDVESITTREEDADVQRFACRAFGIWFGLCSVLCYFMSLHRIWLLVESDYEEILVDCAVWTWCLLQLLLCYFFLKYVMIWSPTAIHKIILCSFVPTVALLAAKWCSEDSMLFLHFVASATGGLLLSLVTIQNLRSTEVMVSIAIALLGYFRGDYMFYGFTVLYFWDIFFSELNEAEANYEEARRRYIQEKKLFANLLLNQSYDQKRKRFEVERIIREEGQHEDTRKLACRFFGIWFGLVAIFCYGTSLFRIWLVKSDYEEILVDCAVWLWCLLQLLLCYFFLKYAMIWSRPALWRFIQYSFVPAVALLAANWCGDDRMLFLHFVTSAIGGLLLSLEARPNLRFTEMTMSIAIALLVYFRGDDLFYIFVMLYVGDILCSEVIAAVAKFKFEKVSQQIHSMHSN